VTNNLVDAHWGFRPHRWKEGVNIKISLIRVGPDNETGGTWCVGLVRVVRFLALVIIEQAVELKAAADVQNQTAGVKIQAHLKTRIEM